MKILVTGASGFVGSRLCRLLCAEGYHVTASFALGDDTRLIDALPVERLPADLLDRAAVRRAAAGKDAVMHVAGLVSFMQRDYQRQLAVNVDGTRNLLRASAEAQVARFVYTSTVNTLGIPPAGTVGDEDTPFDWQRFHLGYMDSKHAAQQLVLESAAAGFPALSVLPGTVFGPGDINGNAGQYIVACAGGWLKAAPPGGTSVVHVDDVARGHLLALRRGKVGQRYIVAGENLSYFNMFNLIASELGKAPPRITLPAGVLRGLGAASDWLTFRLGTPIPPGLGLMEAASARLFYSSAKAKADLGYTFRPAADAIADAVAWYRAQGRI